MQHVKRDTCSATGGPRTRVQLWFLLQIVLQKPALCFPCLHRWTGAGSSRSKPLLEGAIKQMLAWGHKLRLPETLRSQGASSTRGQKSRRIRTSQIFAQAKSSQGRRTKTPPCPSVPRFFGFPWLILSKEFPWLFLLFLCFFSRF